ncbi:MAG: hypothetical protein OXG36_06870 [Caldilineaceae bacterium]|nr:hypothetical protein [Caldilineaceae bacterium]
MDAEQLPAIARGCWDVENGLHGILDMPFREDACRLHRGHAPAVLDHPAPGRPEHGTYGSTELRLEGWFGRFKPRARLARGLKTPQGTQAFLHLLAGNPA